MEIICDKCCEKTEIDVRKESVEGIEVQYFLCDVCNEKYITCCIDEHIKEEQRKFKSIKSKLNNANKIKRKPKRDKTIKELLDKQQVILKDMKDYSEELKRKLYAKEDMQL